MSFYICNQSCSLSWWPVGHVVWLELFTLDVACKLFCLICLYLPYLYSTNSWLSFNSIPVYGHSASFSPLRKHTGVRHPLPTYGFRCFLKILFYGHSWRSCSIKCGMFEKMKARTFWWVILRGPLSVWKQELFKKQKLFKVQHYHASASSWTCQLT